MANKHLSEDEIQYTVDVKTAKAQQEIHKLETQSASLRNENKQRLQQMIKLEASGKKETDQYKKLAASYKDTSKQIKDLTSRIQEQTRSLDTNAMTMSQLRKQSKSLQKELDNVSQSLNPKQYEALESRLKTVNARMAELKQNAKNFKELASSDEYNNFFMGQLAVKGIETFVGWGKSLLGTLSDSVDKSIELAESADGITQAFEKIGTADYLKELRTATKGTVSDIELMKAAVKAKDFRIPLEDLGKYLSFAQLKAQQTGQSLDYMVDSIVTGLGRKSPMILDNLGLSAAEIKEQTEKTGDFMKGVAKIVETNLAQAGETYISAADRAAQRTVELENAQRSLGEALLPIKEEFSDVYGQIQVGAIKAIKYLVEHRDTLVLLTKAVVLLTATYAAYIAGQKLSYLWSLRAVAVSKLKAAAAAVENAMLQLSVLRHAVLNKTMTTSIALQKAFNVVLKLSPWGLIFGAITLVVGALLMFNKRTDAATVAQKKLNDIQAEASRKVEEERIKIEMLTKRIHDNSLSLAERQDAIAALQKIVPDYTAKLTREGQVYDENTRALTRYLNALKEKALLEGAQATIKDLGKQKAELLIKQRQQEKELKDLKQEQANFTRNNAGRPQTSQGNVAPGQVYAASGYSAEVSAMSRQLQDTADKIKVIDTSLDAIGKEFGKKLFSADSGNGGGGGGNANIGTVGAELDAIDKKIEALKAKRLTIKVGDTKGLKAIDNQIAQLEKRKSQLEYKSGGGKKGKKGTKAVDADGIASRNFSSSRQSSLDAANAAYQKDVNNLNMSLAQKKISQEQYDIYISALNTQHATNLLTIEQNYYTKSTQMAFKDAAKKKELETGQSKNVAQAQQKLEEARIAAEEKYQAVMTQLIDQGKVQQTLTLEQERDAKLEVLRGYYDTALQLAQQSGEDESAVDAAYQQARINILSEYNDKQLAKMKEFEQQKAQARQEYGLDSFEDQLAARRKKIENDTLLNEQERQQALTLLDQQAEEHRLQIRQQYGLATQQELYNAELEMLQLHLQNKEISQEKYEEAVKNLKIQKAKEAFDYYAGLAGGAVKALQDAEMANVDAKYDAEIEAARNAGKDTTDIEKKKADEKLKIQKKYADVNFAIKASQIIADTAVSIMKALGELGPIAGPIAAALMGVTGVAQLAAANAERQKVKRMTLSGASGSASASGARVATGLESGGSIDIEREQDGKLFHAAYDPDRRGFINKPTVIVGEGGYGHSKEWVASNAAVENPTVAPIIDIIDRAQRAGKIRTLDMNKFLIQQASGRASGGHIVPTTSDVRGIAQDSFKDSLIKRLTDVLDRISVEGIPASVALNELEQKQQLRDKARKYGSKE
ncbi:MAG: 2-oxoacid:ferredoxin oxidoreductase subunit delta [Prevotella buccae]|uniref:2-oxoacid:ferredoxin oxidoreductase subunit delta n=1 Tax=Segatella buccae TaxID=28126 RepID=UPI00242F30BC|nr:2-oxoacid:ferredoxin oxidoreductase subunit delta [Segatella buccae]MBS5895124.1 2-oxoacid:ferredoxin oxidoreductase subunit delta [Segatella buccae]